MKNLNPLFWLHVRLAGSWRSYLYLAGAYVALVIAGASLSYRLAKPADHGSVSATWLAILSGAQAFFLLLIVPSAVRRAVLRDFQTGMIESHRLSPMSNFKIVAGYLTGPAAQGLTLYLTSLLLGTYFVNEYVQSLGVVGVAPGITPVTAAFGWYFFQACLLFLTFMAVTLVALTAVASAGKAQVLGLFIMIGVFGGWVLLTFVPGLALLLGVLSGDLFISLIIQRRAKVAGGEGDVALAAIGQLAFGILFILATCRKIRSPERAMFSIPLGLILLCVWGAALVAGIARAPHHPSLFRMGLDNTHTAQIIASTVAFLILAQLPLIAAAVDRWHLHRALAFGAPANNLHRFAALLMPVMLALLTMSLIRLMWQVMPAESEDRWLGAAFQDPRRLGAMLAALLLSFWIDFQWLYISAVRGWKVFWAVLFSAVLLKALPILIDLLIASLEEEFREVREIARQYQDYCTGGSPIGTLMLCLSSKDVPWGGLIFQAALAAAFTAWAARVRRAFAVRPAPDAARPAAG